MKIRLVLVLLATCMSHQLRSQTVNTMPALSAILPVSPNAASLGKYAETPVGYYTGIPNISIPIYEINTGTMKLPISISYHAGGIKVEEISSWVGLGWSLNSGGVITRQVRGMPDENSGGYLSSYSMIDQYLNNSMTATQAQTYLDNMKTGVIDGQQDIFLYNFGNESGKFIFDSTGAILTIPKSRNKFEFGTFSGQSNVWRVTDIEGIQYYFTVKENTTFQSVTNGSFGTGPIAGFNATSSWFLAKMISPLGTDSITFSYQGELSSNNTITAQTVYYLTSGAGCSAKPTDNSSSDNTIISYRLSQINFRNGSITFTPASQQRCDYRGDSSLNFIEIKNSTGSFDKKFQFYQSYWTTNSTNCDTTHPENTRLFLDSMAFSDPTGIKGKYRFVYNKSSNLPSRLSFNQDYWGYYNGASNGSNFVPTTNLDFTGGINILNGANRLVNSSYTQLGLLQSISYPTAGKTVFTYENNTASNVNPTFDYIVSSGYIMITAPVNPPRIMTKSFTVNSFGGSGGANVVFTVNPGSTNCAQHGQFGCPITTLYYPDGSGANLNSTVTIFLPAGNYQIKGDCSSVTDPNVLQNYSVQVSWPQGAMESPNLRYNIAVGGLRIKNITNYNTDNSIASVKQYTYLQPGLPFNSSGTLVSFPQYQGTVTMITPSTCIYTTLSSNTTQPLMSTQGSMVGYRYVQEFLGASGEFGRNDYEFTAPDVFQDNVGYYFPFPPSTSFDWKRGALVHERNYRFNTANGVYELIQEKINKYQDNMTNTYPGIKENQNTFYNVAHNNVYTVTSFFTESGWFPKISDTVRIYDQNNLAQYAQIVHNYGYNPLYFLPIADTSSNSKGETTITTMKYPLDYSGLTGADALTQGIQNLQNKNMLSPVIEKFSQIQNAGGSNNRFTGSLLTSYKASIALPDTVWATELTAGSTTFTPSSVSGGTIVKSGLYKPELSFLKYDFKGNTIQEQKINDLNQSYIWDYSNTYPIAECKNADSISIAFTSFEADGSGNWTIPSSTRDNANAITGLSSYNLTSGAISKSGLTSSNSYVVSYWSRSGSSFTVSGSSSVTQGKTINGWTYFEHIVSGVTSVSVSGSADIDELRLYPKGALMTTYCYQPLSGMTSQCDMDNRITYYRYDGLGRLKVVLDQDGNILKTIDYYFQTQN
jgi:YD repeat-containing protein